ncbi:MAG: alpha/beta fold hydrolase [Pseudomonadota bacterium]
MLLPLLLTAALAAAAPPVVPGTEMVELGSADSSTFCLLVHGFAGSRKDFDDLGERLAALGCRVRMDRLPGHGTTPEDMEATTATELTDHVRAEVREARERYRRVILVGFSMGGVLSTIVASTEPVDRLVLIAPAYAVTPQWYYFGTAEVWNRRLAKLVRWVPKTQGTVQVNRKEARPELFAYKKIPTKAVNVLAELGELARSPAVLGDVTAPTLILHSPSDFAASQAASAAAFPLLGSEEKRYVTMDPRNNHHLLKDWDREQAKAEILTFLAPALPPEGAP